MPTEADWKRRVEEMKKSEAPIRAINETLLRQAVVASDLLTSHPAWDVYLQRLQVHVEATNHELMQVHGHLATPLTSEELRQGYVSINVLTERLRILHYCMALPKEILAHAHDALDKPAQ